MEQDKTPLERAWLHVIEGEGQVDAQVARIGELLSLRKDTTEADAVFDALNGKLRLLRKTLEQEQAEAARRRT
jgi:DNA mismatch repair protein MutH